jgi:hypothetical protein
VTFRHIVEPNGGRRRRALCGKAMCVSAYLPEVDGITDPASGLPLASGHTNPVHADCPECIAVERGRP